MKKIVVFLICIYSSLSYSQIRDLYILIDNEAVFDTIRAKNDSINLKIYRLNFNSNSLEYEFYINEDQKLSKRIFSKSRKSKIIELVYKSVRGNNPQIMINEDQVVNLLTYKEMLYAKNFDNLISVIKSFDRIFISNMDNKSNDLMIVEKVTLVPPKPNL